MYTAQNTCQPMTSEYFRNAAYIGGIQIETVLLLSGMNALIGRERKNTENAETNAEKSHKIGGNFTGIVVQ